MGEGGADPVSGAGDGLREVRALAEAATPGPWIYLGSGTSAEEYGHKPGSSATYANEDGSAWLVIEHAAFGRQAVHDAAYIAAVSPDVVLGLLDRIAELEGQLERTEQQIHERGGFIDQVVDGEAAVSQARRDAQEAIGADLTALGAQSGRGCQRCGGPSRYDLCRKCSEHLAATPMTDQELRILDAGLRPSGSGGLIHLTNEEWQAVLHAGAIETAKLRAKTKARQVAWDLREKAADDGSKP